MATTLSLKRRIQAAKNVSKTTKAMQMIAASKLKKAQEAALSTRPYVNELDELTKKIVGALEKSDYESPYLKVGSGSGKTLFVVIAPDKGLCGGLISNLLHHYAKYEGVEREDVYAVVVGKKAEGSVVRLNGDKVVASFHFGTTVPAIDAVRPIMKIVDEYYLSGKVDNVMVIYSHFKNFFSQVPTIKTLLPTSLPVEDEKAKSSSLYSFEPSAKEILPILMSHQLEMALYHCLLESFVSEQASRMIAMQNATNNANDVIEDLKLEYNKTRQANVTSELLDITGARMASA